MARLKAVKYNQVTDFSPSINIRSNSLQQNLFISGVFLCVLSTIAYLFWGLTSLTIVNSKQYSVKANDNALTEEYEFAKRGLIYDRNGNQLVENVKTYDLYINPAKITLDKVQELYPQLQEQITSFKEDHKDLAAISRNYLLAHNIKKDLALDIKAKTPEGIVLREGTVRNYPLKDSFSHLLGYTGIASDTDLKRDTSIVYNDIVGKNGVEYQYDIQLRGIHGKKYTLTDATGDVNDGSEVIEKPVNGSTLYLTIDKEYQQVLFDKVKKYVQSSNARGGSAMIIDVDSGAVRAIVSYPSYDNNLFVGGISVADYKKLTDSPQVPLLFRPISSQEPPGSTFKTIVAAAALEESAITENTVINSPGVINLSGTLFQEYRQRAHGNITVKDALMVSSNIYFCRTITKLGIDKFLPYADKFGMGKHTGIDLPGEMRGRVPSPENKLWLANNGASWLDPIWYPEGDACNSAIGQGIALTTPVQMGVVATAIANGGKMYKPYVTEKIIQPDGKETLTQPQITQENFVSPNSLRIVREGMRMSVNGPRAIITSLKNSPVSVAAKTGTAEFGIKDKYGYSTAHAWIIGFYPYEKPKYAFVVLLEGGGNSTNASNVIREFLLTAPLR
jgi:penicillin-binding protein 2